MACQLSTIEEIEKLQDQESKAKRKEPATKIKLMRGGTVVYTKLGPIQFSMVPETVKDSLTLQIEVPSIFIMPHYRFDKRFCLSVAEFEFPAYFNFFVKRRKIVLVCDEIGEQAVRAIFQETLLGPGKACYFYEDFASDYKGRPDLMRELSYFAKNPFNPAEVLTVDTLISFCKYNKFGVAELGEGVQVKREEERFYIFEDGEEIAKIKDKVEILIDSEITQQYIEYGLFPGDEDTQTETFLQQQFDPPIFGITVLGCSHGFDPKGSTSGYIVWINKRGVMVDPPPYSTLLLRKMGIPTHYVKWLIISHTHADHDAGAFQKLLESEKIELITTRTIMESFVRKYSAMTDFTTEYIKTLFNYRPVKIGHPTRVNGAEFDFFYALHSIPTVGFSVRVLDKSLYLSGDTYYDPEGLLKIYEKGFLSQERYEFLVSD